MRSEIYDEIEKRKKEREYKKMSQNCKFWEVGHNFMNCRYCDAPNQKYCKDKFGDGTIEAKFCPRCGEVYLRSSLSRLDNKTKICGACGNWEAMIDFKFLFEMDSTEKINDKLNIIGTLKGKRGQTSLHEFKYFEKIEKLLNAKLEKLYMLN